MQIRPIAIFHSPYGGKFGCPRQSGLAPDVVGTVELVGECAVAEAVRGLDGFDYIWLIWGFSENTLAEKHPTVRPPRLGGNRRMGVWATRSSFRPNNLALSSVRLLDVSAGGGRVLLRVAGADLIDGTSIYDIKPYLEPFDSHTGIRSGFIDTEAWQPLEVEIPKSIADSYPCDTLAALRETLAEDPRPHYIADGGREYAMTFAAKTVRFRVEAGKAIVTNIE